jgi:hypothetical protein
VRVPKRSGETIVVFSLVFLMLKPHVINCIILEGCSFQKIPPLIPAFNKVTLMKKPILPMGISKIIVGGINDESAISLVPDARMFSSIRVMVYIAVVDSLRYLGIA